MRVSHDVQKVRDGGQRAWLTCLGSFCVFLNTFGLTNSYGVFQAFYSAELLSEYSASQISWIGSFQTFLLISLGIFAGPVFDRGYLKPMLVCGSILSVVGTVAIGFSSEYWHFFLSQGLVVGTGAGLLSLPSTAILAQYFRQHLAFATGLAASGGAVGSIFYSIAFNSLQPRIGFRYATWTIAGVMLCTLGISCITLQARLHPLKARRILDTRAFREVPFYLWSSHLFVSMLGVYVPSFYIQTYGLQYMASTQAFYLLPVLNAGSFFGRILPLYAADRIGYFNVLIVSTFCASAAAYAWIEARSSVGCFIFSGLYGFVAGDITTITSPIEVSMCPCEDIVGTRLGMFVIPWAVGFLIGNPLAGAILGAEDDWRHLQIFVGSVMAAAALLGFAARVSKHGRTAIC